MSNIATTAMSGLNYAHFAPITSTEDGTYTVGTAKRYYGAISLSNSQSGSTSDSTVRADDKDFLTSAGSKTETENLTLTLAQIKLEDYAEMSGMRINSKGELEYNPTNRKEVPKYAFSIASPIQDNKYRMMKYYFCTIQDIQCADIQTNGGNAQAANITIIMIASKPNIDKALSMKWDDKPLAMEWLTDFTDYEEETTP